ncbi:ribosomal protein S18-alanine N-acetyltransferase [Ruminococcus flavefaciens]|uniref:ribosomal protein S18-alanine N-acetyltransferase n=1 Tax=Ruminococcus flavefaciens TaxID=1265 RepID=UPI000465431B|nr:ribosomal protein S18-alanine N-acetyltransferase [Ruminococcus flavefaciens]
MNNSQFSILNSQLNYDELSALDKLCVGADGWSAENFRSEAEKDGGIVLAAYDGDCLAGLIAGFTAADTGEILTVGTAPQYRRQGVARMLMEAFLAAIPDDVETIALEVRQSNTAAIELYKSFGFDKAGVRKRFYRDPIEDADVMVLARAVSH